MNTLEIHERAGILRKTADVYKLRTPTRLIISKKVLDRLRSIYMPSYERGGVMEGEIRGKDIYISGFAEVPNTATVGYSYSPNMGAFVNQFYAVLNRGSLPFAIHTHPTSLGISHYDEKRARFYQNSSKADKRIARRGVIDNLVLPEAIFVADARLKGGYAVNFYTGDNRANVIGGGLIGLSVLKKSFLPGLLGGAILGVNYLISSEKVTDIGGGDLEVIIRN